LKRDKSLLAIKNDIAKKENILRSLQKTHPHLKHLSEIQILAYFNINSIDELSTHITNLKASTLSHDNLMDDKRPICSCTNSDGQAKDLYDSEESAQKEAAVLIVQQKLQLKVYVCPNGCGWHLTKG
jgi:hypothetical protein